MRRVVRFYIPYVILFLFLFHVNNTTLAQTTEEEIKLIKEKIEQLNERLRDLEAARSVEEQGHEEKNETSTPDPVTFLNSSGAGISKTAKPEPTKTLLTGSGTFNLADSGDPRRYNAIFSPLFHRQIADDLHLVLKPEFQLEEDSFDIGLGAGELDYFLNDFITLRGGKLQSPLNLTSDKTYPSLLNESQFIPVLYPRAENRPSSDILSDLRDIGVGVSGDIPFQFFGGTSIDYGISFVNGINGPGVMNFSFSISRHE